MDSRKERDHKHNNSIDTQKNDKSKVHPSEYTINSSVMSEHPVKRDLIYDAEENDGNLEVTSLSPKEQGKSSFEELRQVIARALNEKFEDEKKKELIDLATYSPIFVVSHFVKAFIYHLLYFMVLGPMTVPILLCFESCNYIVNMGFLPGKDFSSRMYFLIQNMTWMLYIACVVFLVLNRMEASEEEDSIQPLDYYPFFLLSAFMLARVVVISVRYATTHQMILDDMNNGELGPQAYRERLLSQAWITMAPHVVLNEIEMGMVRVGANDKFFKFKTLTPLYPSMVGKLTDHEYWENELWSQKMMVKQERRELSELGKTMRIFKNNAKVDKKTIMNKFKKLPDNFSETYDYLKKLVLENRNFDPEFRIDGKLWLRELFLQAQANMP